MALTGFYYFLKVKALEKLSKSLKDSRKLAAGESYSDLGSVDEDGPVKYRHADKRSPCARQRPKSLNFEIFFEGQGENRTDDEKLEDSNGEIDGMAQSLNNELASRKVSQTEDNELHYDVLNKE